MQLFKYFFATLVIVASALAQNDDPIKVDTSIVRLNVGVVDFRGRPITRLTKSEFTLYEDGVKQEISLFEPGAAPFSIVMLLDMSGSTRSFRQNIQFSAMRFLDALSSEDRIAVIEFYDKVNVLNDFTADRRTAAHSISVANGKGDTNLYKALRLALQKLAGEEKRRKAIVVLTDGVDTPAQNLDRKSLINLLDSELPAAIKPESNEALRQVLSYADAMGVTVYPLALPTGDPKKLADPTPRQIAMYSAARSRLKILAERSGGTLHSINRLEEMSQLYALVAADLRTLYTIEYQPTNDKRDGKWRSIKIETRDSEFISRTRPGYFAR